MSSSDREELLAWCAALVSETISDDDFARLQAALATDAEARRIYVGYVHLHRALSLWSAADATSASSAMASLDTPPVSDSAAALGQAAETSAAQSPQSIAPQPAPIGHLSWLNSALPPRLISLCILVVLLGYFGSLLTSLIRDHRRLAMAAASPKSNDQATEAIAGAGHSVRRLKSSPDIRWRGRPAASEPQASQLLELEAGSAQFDLTGGTRVVVAAPARFRIESAARVWLERGQLVAHVGPRGSGFTVATPTVEVIDLGTEFGVEVEESAATNVVVRQGKVDVRPAPSAAGFKDRPREIQRLRAGQAVRVSTGGEVTSLDPADAQRKAGRFAALADKLPAEGQIAPKLLAWYRLGEDDSGAPPGEPSAPRTLPNRASASAEPLQIEGTVQYTDRVEAPHSRRALSFGSAATTSVSGVGPEPALTDDFALVAWVRIETAAQSSWIVHWGSGSNGISLALLNGCWCGIFQHVEVLNTETKFEPGKWTHLALVRVDGQTHLYVDGRIVGGPWPESPKPPDKLLRIGEGSQIEGQIDEVRLFDLRDGFRPEWLRE